MLAGHEIRLVENSNSAPTSACLVDLRGAVMDGQLNVQPDGVARIINHHELRANGRTLRNRFRN